MKRVLVAAVAAVLISAAGFAQKTDDQMIRDRVAEFEDAWNKHDPAAMTAIWSFDGDLINPSGRRAKGMTEIQKLFTDEHAGLMKASTYKVTDTKIRFVGPDLAFLDTDVEVAGIANPDGTTATLKPHVFSVMRKSGGQWWIASARAYNYLPPPPPPAPK